MATAETRLVHRSWPIVYGHRRNRPQGHGTGVAWALFLLGGVPCILMAALSVLARAGIYVDFLRPLWQPWPPDLLKPFLGIAGFAATLAYLTYRVGHRSGFRRGEGAGYASARIWVEAQARAHERATTMALPAPPTPPPPPDDEPLEWL